MTNHYQWAGGFLALCIVGLTLAVKFGVEGGMAAAAHESHEGVHDVPHGEAAGHEETVSRHGTSAPENEEHAESAPEAPAVEEDPKARLVRQMRTAIFLGRQGEFAAAAEALQVLAAEFPEEASVWLNLGLARMGTGNTEAAKLAFQEALRLEPNDDDARAELANLELEAGRLDAALAIVESIEPGRGRMASRLSRDERWRRHTDDPRVAALRAKHGLETLPDTSERVQRELEARRRAAGSSTVASSSVAASTPHTSTSTPSATPASTATVSASSSTTAG